MRILVTGGTGVIGNGVIPKLIAHGHTVRLLSRHADEDAKRWQGVEPFSGNVADASTLFGAAEGCDAVLHIAGVVTENPPTVTFETVNVGGTRNVVAEAHRANARRFVHMSSLGADRGTSDYHRSKHESEVAVERSGLDWTILRPGNVYGPGDEVISLMLKMVRSLPAVPMVNRGDQQFQPVWFEDLADAIIACIESKDTVGRTIELTGADTVTMAETFERIAEVTGRSPVRLPVPATLINIASRIAGNVVDLPVDENKLTMLEEKNVATDGATNLRLLLGRTPTSFDEGLKKLADMLLEQLPEDGVGSMEHKTFWADITGSKYPPSSLMAEFTNRLNEVMPLEFEAEPGVTSEVKTGGTLTGALPLRGNFQVRVQQVEPNHVVLATIEGHPLAGIVEFTTSAPAAGLTRFAIDVHARAANVFDFLALRTVGEPMQAANWRAVVQRVVDLSGGTSDGVHTESRRLDDEEAAKVEERVRSLVQKRERETGLESGERAT